MSIYEQVLKIDQLATEISERECPDLAIASKCGMLSGVLMCLPDMPENKRLLDSFIATMEKKTQNKDLTQPAIPAIL